METQTGRADRHRPGSRRRPSSAVASAASAAVGGLPIPIPRGRVGLVVLALLVIGGLIGGNTLLGDGGGDPGDETPVACPIGAQPVTT